MFKAIQIGTKLNNKKNLHIFQKHKSWEKLKQIFSLGIWKHWGAVTKQQPGHVWVSMIPFLPREQPGNRQVISASTYGTADMRLFQPS